MDAQLMEANLQETNLNYANLKGANLTGANLKQSLLNHAILGQVNFCGTIMENGAISLKGCSVQGIYDFSPNNYRKHYSINRSFD